MNAIRTFLKNEIIKYLIAGVLTTLVYLLIRLGIYPLLQSATLASIIASIIAVCFAFYINDRYVFNQVKTGWQKRFVTFFLARLFTTLTDFALAYIFVDAFPDIIGQFVQHNRNTVNTIVTLASQVIILVANYLISKLLVFQSNEQ